MRWRFRPPSTNQNVLAGVATFVVVVLSGHRGGGERVRQREGGMWACWGGPGILGIVAWFMWQGARVEACTTFLRPFLW